MWTTIYCSVVTGSISPDAYRPPFSNCCSFGTVRGYPYTRPTKKPFETNTGQARIYDDYVGWVVLTGHDASGQPTRTTTQKVLELGADNVRQDSAREVLIDLTSL
ncbi:unnamed protein product [Prunus armeniaca]|uniref:Uncharacterized protein n=1 Tax=Prunus armeniaca TaxID=36596 RepID=A0A6J5TKF2_PRUAR|nr:unnamed protein product [Prunus armeniaca]